MRTREERAMNLKIAYIGGGSKGWAWTLMSDLALEENLGGIVKLYDIDHTAAEDNEILGNMISTHPDSRSKWAYKAVGSLQEALDGADFVIISILPGTFAEMESDVHAPEAYGIYQSVGDTVGPGGIVRALRSIPMFVEIAEAIKKYSPAAWVINYTNPLSICVRTLYAAYPEIKAFGCCHEVFGTQALLAHMVSAKLGDVQVERDDIRVNVLGINHFTWLDEARYGQLDLFPLYEDFVSQHWADGFEINVKDAWLSSHFASAERVKFDLFRTYGLIAAAGDRHLAEFMPGNRYLKDPETVKSWKFHLTPVSWRVENKKRLIRLSQAYLQGSEVFELKSSGEEGVGLIKGLLGLGDFVTNVNMPNRGQIGNLPLEAIVETNAAVTANGVQPIFAGELPVDIQNLTMQHLLNQESLLEAGLNKDRSQAFRVFLNDPLVSIPFGEALELFKLMLLNTKKYLPGWTF